MTDTSIQGHSTERHAKKAEAPRSAYTPLAIGFVLLVIISNVCATKGVVMFPSLKFHLGPLEVNGLVTDGAFWIFPLSYVIGDVISEVWGFRAMRRIILWGFVGNVLAAAGFWVTIQLPAADFYTNQKSLEAVIGVVPQILLASLAGFVMGETLNSLVLVKMKERTGEPMLWARLLGSTVVGELADTTTFCLIAAPVIGITTASDTINYIIIGFVWKTLCEMLVMPITYQVCRVIKRHEPTYA